MQVTTTQIGTVNAVRAQVQRYVNHVGSKAKTGVESLDTSMRAAYAKSLCLFLLPPLVANLMINIDDVHKIVASLGKKMEGVAKQTNHKVYINLREGGQDGTPAQVMAAGAKLAEGLKDALKQGPKKGQYQQECSANELINKFKPKPMQTEEENEAEFEKSVEYTKLYKEKREKYKLTNDEVVFACNLTQGKLSGKYYSVSYCKDHQCEVNRQHIDECHLFTTGNGNTRPKDWMFTIQDKEKDLFSFSEPLIALAVSSIQQLQSRIKLAQD
jgi:hypothetical protein